MKINEQRGYLPDVAWFPEDRCGQGDPEGGFSGPPALVVEVLSPSTRTLDALRKRSDYARAGAEELWLIDPAMPAAQVYRRPAAAPAAEFELTEDLEGDGKLASPLLDGFEVLLSTLIAR